MLPCVVRGPTSWASVCYLVVRVGATELYVLSSPGELETPQLFILLFVERRSDLFPSTIAKAVFGEGYDSFVFYYLFIHSGV